MEQERVLIECKPATLRLMKDDPDFLVRYVEDYMENNLGIAPPVAPVLAPLNAESVNTQKDSDRIEDMLNEIKKIKRKLKKLNVKQVRFMDEDEQYELLLNKRILKIMKKIENLTDKINAGSNHNQKELVVVMYEETEFIRKLREWQNGSGEEKRE